jgi:hypothetical protein
MHKSATKCNETSGKWCKNKHGASKIIDTLETHHKTSKYKKRNLPLEALAAFRYSTHSLPKAMNFFIKFCPENRA